MRERDRRRERVRERGGREVEGYFRGVERRKRERSERRGKLLSGIKLIFVFLNLKSRKKK